MGITVESVLEKALHGAGAISVRGALLWRVHLSSTAGPPTHVARGQDDNAGSFHKVGWTRAARTDKGVHAASNLIGFKAIIGPSQLMHRFSSLPKEPCALSR